MKSFKPIYIISLFFSYSIMLPSYADGLKDLKRALKTLNNNTPITAIVESAYSQKRGKKNNIKTKTGLAQVNVQASNQGIKLFYNDETLEKLEIETQQKEVDAEKNTPTLNAIDDINIAELHNMLSSAPQILRLLNKATFINEEVISLDEQSFRQLNFTLPLETIISNKEVHEYVDDFQATYHIVINQEGIPVSSQTSFSGSGSAYIFFTMELTQSNKSSFKNIDGRLINIERTYKTYRRSTWGTTDAEGYKIMIVQSKL